VGRVYIVIAGVAVAAVGLRRILRRRGVVVGVRLGEAVGTLRALVVAVDTVVVVKGARVDAPDI
jgi:hypothetical protein